MIYSGSHDLCSTGNAYSPCEPQMWSDLGTIKTPHLDHILPLQMPVFLFCLFLYSFLFIFSPITPAYGTYGRALGPDIDNSRLRNRIGYMCLL